MNARTAGARRRFGGTPEAAQPLDEAARRETLHAVLPELSWRNERAAAYGIAPDELEERYRKRTTLGVDVLPDDVARAVLHFASTMRSGKTTGNLLNVDGGVAAAYPR